MVALNQDLQAILLISRSRLFQVFIPLTLNARAKNVFLYLILNYHPYTLMNALYHVRVKFQMHEE